MPDLRFRLANIQAALGVAQLEQLPGFLERKREIYGAYRPALQDMVGLTLENGPVYADNNHWMKVLQVDSSPYGEDQQALMVRLEKNGIETRPVWALIHMQEPYRNCQNHRIEQAEGLVKNSLCLPSSTNPSDEDDQLVSAKLHG